MGPIVNQYGSHMLMTDVKKETKNPKVQAEMINKNSKNQEDLQKVIIIDKIF